MSRYPMKPGEIHPLDPPLVSEKPPWAGERFRSGYLGIMAGAVTYALLVLLVLAISSMPNAIQNELNLIQYVVICMMALFFTFLFMLLMVTPVTALALGFSSLVAYTVVDRMHWPSVAGFAGGLTGFLFTGTVALSNDDSFMNPYWWVAISLGPGLATVLGQFGAVWMTSRSEYLIRRASNSQVASAGKFRFDIRQIMIATTWVAGILTLLKLTNALGPWTAGIVAGWLTYQAITLGIILLVVKKVRGYA